MAVNLNIDTNIDEKELVDLVRTAEYGLSQAADLDPLLDYIGDARYVLLGEASHGTSEYYTWRTRLSQRLIREKGFSFIAVEGDWPHCYEVNRYVKGYDDAKASAQDLLHAFVRWPTWMWANWEMVALIEWLRDYNAKQSNGRLIGFYGLDVYSLWESLEGVLHYLAANAPEAVEAAHRAYFCFEPYGKDAQSYAWSTAFVPQSCENEVVNLLSTVRRQTHHHESDPEAAFNAEQNALVTVNAEHYYRAMVRGGANSWNVRDRHMVTTLERLMESHRTKEANGPAKAILWEHNSHIGDARATDMARAGMVNVGQLVRQRHAREGVVAVGFGSYSGSVIASSEWGATMRRMRVPPAQPGSWENILHGASDRDKLLLLHAMEGKKAALAIRGHRAIGVVYNPDSEDSNYVPTILPSRYDAFIYVDKMNALHPLHVNPQGDQPPEMYPWSL